MPYKQSYLYPTIDPRRFDKTGASHVGEVGREVCDSLDFVKWDEADLERFGPGKSRRFDRGCRVLALGAGSQQADHSTMPHTGDRYNCPHVATLLLCKSKRGQLHKVIPWLAMITWAGMQPSTPCWLQWRNGPLRCTKHSHRRFAHLYLVHLLGLPVGFGMAKCPKSPANGPSCQFVVLTIRFEEVKDRRFERTVECGFTQVSCSSFTPRLVHIKTGL